MMQQIFDFQCEKLSWNDFVESDENREVVTYLKHWENWTTRGLIIYGDAGVGKTHLASLWAQSANAIFIKSEDMSRKPRALFEQNYNFVIEEITDFDWLFHFINIAKEKQRYFLITSRQHPLDFVSLADLRSRLALIPTLKIASPKDELLHRIAQKIGRDYSITLDNRSINYILNNITRDVASVKNVIDVLNRLALEMNQPLNWCFVRKYLDATREAKNLS